MDVRGSKVQDVVLVWGLQVMNKFNEYTTFENTQGGRYNIDIKITTRDVSSKVKVDTRAYAGCGLLLVYANTTTDPKRRANRALELITKWLE